MVDEKKEDSAPKKQDKKKQSKNDSVEKQISLNDLNEAARKIVENLDKEGK